VIGLAGQEARQAGHNRVGTENLLLGLLAADAEEHNTAFGVFDLLRIEYIPVRRLIDRDHRSRSAWTPPTPEATGVLCRAERDAQTAGRDQVGTADLLLAVLAESETDGEGVVAGVRAQLGAEPGLLRGWILEALASETDPAEQTTSTPLPETPRSGAQPGQTPESAALRWRGLGEQVRAGLEAAWCGARQWIRTLLAPWAT
jgi:ATP-dependent Clp protease ATP-binding subunit ClpC